MRAPGHRPASRAGRVARPGDRGAGIANRGGIPSEAPLAAGDDPVPRDCVVILDSVEPVPVALLVQGDGRVADARVHDVCEALRVAVDC